jgi:hypothetical protein
MLVLYIYIYITRLASKEMFSLSIKIHGEVSWAKDLSAPLYTRAWILNSRRNNHNFTHEMCVVACKKHITSKLIFQYTIQQMAENSFCKFNKFYILHFISQAAFFLEVNRWSVSLATALI